MGFVEILILASEGDDCRPEVLAFDVLVDSVSDVVGLADVELVLQHVAGRRPGQEVDARSAVFSALACSRVVAAGGDHAQACPVGLLDQPESVGPSISEVQPDGGTQGFSHVRHERKIQRCGGLSRRASPNPEGSGSGFQVALIWSPEGLFKELGGAPVGSGLEVRVHPQRGRAAAGVADPT
jgi:hypothetical protein